MNLVNLKAFIKELNLKKQPGQVKFAAVANFLAKGKLDEELEVYQVESNWPKQLLRVQYSDTYYERALRDGLINPADHGKRIFLITDKTASLMAELSADEAILSGEVKKTGALYIVNRKGAHSYDKFLIQILSGAKQEVLLADSYVNELMFLSSLDKVTKNAIVKLIYKQADDQDKFDHRSNRFKTQYPKYDVKKYRHLHDRCLIVDDVGYILGSSIKDAGDKSPTLIVKLAPKETQSLREFFKELWKISK